jgi:cytochrome c-type biogenesis protein CcmF
VRGYETERDVKMTVGDSVAIGGYRFTFKGADEIQGPNYVAARGTVEVQREGGGRPFVMHPEKRLYKVQNMPMTEADIETGLFRDLYVSLGEMLDDKTWTVRVYHKPFVDWIWGGSFIMALGGVLALSDRRYRVAVKAVDLAALQAPADPPPGQPQPAFGSVAAAKRAGT